MEIQELLASQLPANSVDKLVPETTNKFLTLEFSNRYFTLDARGIEEEIPMNPLIDPLSLLRNRVPPNAKHVSDNQVLYYERKGLPEYVSVMSFNAKVNPRYSPRHESYNEINPTAIQITNLVEIQVGFSAIPIAKGRYKVLSKLRSICVLDRAVESVSQF